MALIIPKQLTPGISYDAPVGPGLTEERSFIDQVDQNHEEVGLPPGFPKYLNSSLVWSGPQLGSHQYICHLTEGDKLEIDTALISFKGAESSLSLSVDYLPHFSGNSHLTI